MPRGVKKNYSDQIALIDNEILKYQEKIKTLKEQRSKLESAKRDADLSELYKIMDEKSISPDELVALVKNKK